MALALQFRMGSKMPMMTLKFELGDRVKIVELKCSGRVVGIFVGDSGAQFNVRYFYNGEAKTVYFYTDELELEKS